MLKIIDEIKDTFESILKLKKRGPKKIFGIEEDLYNYDLYSLNDMKENKKACHIDIAWYIINRMWSSNSWNFELLTFKWLYEQPIARFFQFIKFWYDGNPYFMYYDHFKGSMGLKIERIKDRVNDVEYTKDILEPLVCSKRDQIKEFCFVRSESVYILNVIRFYEKSKAKRKRAFEYMGNLCGMLGDHSSHDTPERQAKQKYLNDYGFKTIVEFGQKNKMEE